MSLRPREDAERNSAGRYVVATTLSTKWINSWEEFRACGGVRAFSEDQTEIELQLPVGHKFSIKFGE